jgi:hypothetical protein
VESRRHRGVRTPRSSRELSGEVGIDASDASDAADAFDAFDAADAADAAEGRTEQLASSAARNFLMLTRCAIGKVSTTKQASKWRLRP